MNSVIVPLRFIMNACLKRCGNYGIAIILFTFLTKIILLPLTVWTYFNSVKMIKIQPDINFIRAKYYGQQDLIGEEEAKLYKEQGYHPLLSTIPIIIQLVLLIGVVAVIREGIADPAIDMRFGPVDLGQVPAETGIGLIYAPLLAGLSSLLLSLTQNTDNILQAEQSKWNKYGTMAFSVCLSLYLGWFVPVGTAWYWVLSNLMAIAQMYIMNALIRPRRFVDYERLEESRRELAALKGVGRAGKESLFSENRKRERADYKRFFSVINKHLVFYSESSGFYKYYKGFIEYLLVHTNITIHYVTSDPADVVFSLAEENPQLRAYYIGENRLITLMMKMDADIVAMTMPDLEQFHIKRSYVRKDIEYLYIQHGPGSVNLLLRKGALDHYDTVFVCNDVQKAEIRGMEKTYGLPEKRLAEVGYPLIDEMRAAYEAAAHPEHAKKMILIAPSWQKDNIIDTCLGEILEALKGMPYRITVRPHPQEVRLKQEFISSLEQRFLGTDIVFQKDFSSNDTVLEADLLITDWSDIGFEFSLAARKPVLFINTPMKVMNPDWKEIGVTPLNLSAREICGKSLDVDRIAEIGNVIAELLSGQAAYCDKIEQAVADMLYHPGGSARVGAEYIIQSIQEKIEQKRGREQT